MNDFVCSAAGDAFDSPWKHWPLAEWNHRLLDYFFRRRYPSDSNVAALLVTAEELARAAGADPSNPEDVHSLFVRAVCTAIEPEGSLLGHAIRYPEWPDAPNSSDIPSFVSHLMLACIAATRSADDLADENSFIMRLRELTQERLPDHSLRFLPTLWENLGRWLADNPASYRGLVLPDPGGLTRIGQTVKLAFPDRRDQKVLSELLDIEGFDGDEPPIGPVLALVAANRHRFRERFLESYADFRGLHEKSQPNSRLLLANHQFWSAVRDAFKQGRGLSQSTATDARSTLLGTEEDGRLSLFLAAESDVALPALAFLDLPFNYGEWKVAAQPRGSEELSGELLDKAVRLLLGNRVDVPLLSKRVRQGVLPFLLGSHGLLELAARDQLADVCLCLVQDDCVADICRLYGPVDNAFASGYHGWMVIRGLRLRYTPSSELSSTTLRHAWILHETAPTLSIRVRNGVAVDDGFLGLREVLPVVQATPDATLTTASSAAPSVLEARDGTWSLPARDISGVIHITATSATCGRAVRAIRFHSSAVHESYKLPSEPGAWIVEHVASTDTLAPDEIAASSTEIAPIEDFGDLTYYLQADVGFFTDSPGNAAWVITCMGDQLFGARGRIRASQATPTRQSSNAHACRRWRKLLYNSIPSPEDPGFPQARSQVKAPTSSRLPLPKVCSPAEASVSAAPRMLKPTYEVDRLVRILACLANNRTGIPFNEWVQLVSQVLKISSTSIVHQVSRAWMESGLIDVASFARWRQRMVFARRPHLIAFRKPSYIDVCVSGLSLPSTRQLVLERAAVLGIPTSDRLSVSPYVPAMPVARAGSDDAVISLSRDTGLPLAWLDCGPDSLARMGKHRGLSPPPVHYEASFSVTRWSLSGDVGNADVSVRRYVRRDKPDYWLVEQDQRRLWFYDMNVTRGWAAALLGQPLVTKRGDTSLTAVHGYLPLPLARAVNLAGVGLAGPAGDGSYEYPIGLKRLCDRVIASLNHVYTIHPHAAGEPSQG